MDGGRLTWVAYPWVGMDGGTEGGLGWRSRLAGEQGYRMIHFISNQCVENGGAWFCMERDMKLLVVTSLAGCGQGVH